VSVQCDEEQERVQKLRLVLAKRTRSIATLQRQLDEVPGRAELAQYQHRFLELYNQGRWCTVQIFSDNSHFVTVASVLCEFSVASKHHSSQPTERDQEGTETQPLFIRCKGGYSSHILCCHNLKTNHIDSLLIVTAFSRSLVLR
jgi:hypothetical protein